MGTGTTLSFTPTSADVSGAMPEEQRAAARKKIFAAEPDNRIDFVNPDHSSRRLLTEPR